MILKTQNKLYFGKDFEVVDNIPTGVWLLMFDEIKKEYYLDKQNSFSLPDKIYGDEEIFADRVVETFNILDKNLGVLLSGDKGNGKSLMAKLIAIKANLPIILITQPFVGDSFQNFISSTQQEVVFLLDEFEKVYRDNEKQEEFLPILDGVFQGKKLFIFTTNSSDINTFLKSRPSRIRYFKEYDGLDKKVIEEIIDELLEDKDNKKELLEITYMLGSVSMDVLLNLIQEMNLYKESARLAVSKMNIQIEHTEFDVLMFLKGKRSQSKVYYNPLVSKYIWVSYKEEDSRGGMKYSYFEKEANEMKLESVNGEFIFTDSENNKLIFTPSKSNKFKL